MPRLRNQEITSEEADAIPAPAPPPTAEEKDETPAPSVEVGQTVRYVSDAPLVAGEGAVKPARVLAVHAGGILDLEVEEQNRMQTRLARPYSASTEPGTWH